MWLPLATWCLCEFTVRMEIHGVYSSTSWYSFPSLLMQIVVITLLFLKSLHYRIWEAALELNSHFSRAIFLLIWAFHKSSSWIVPPSSSLFLTPVVLTLELPALFCSLDPPHLYSSKTKSPIILQTSPVIMIFKKVKNNWLILEG